MVVPELPDCVTYGKTEEEARRNIMEALELYLRPSKEEIPKDAKIYEEGRKGVKVKKGRDPLLDLKKNVVKTGIKDLAGHHDHYLYGMSK